nr:MAG TPA: hypothetical protein [Caudoviricetes sp.]
MSSELRKINFDYLQRSLRKMMGYSINLHIYITGWVKACPFLFEKKKADW